MFNIKWIDEYREILKGKRVILRSSLNVPIRNNEIIDDFRIRASLESINFLRTIVKSLFIVAHIGRDKNESLRPVFDYMSDMVKGIKFVKKDDYFTEKPDGVYLFENLRQFDAETNNEQKFAEKLASMADFFVQDAFSVLHREHMSIVSLPEFLPSYGGLLLKKEIENMNKALNPPDNSLFVLGGSKFATKEKLIAKMFEKYKKIFLVGALANEVLASKGLRVGLSKIDDGKIDENLLKNENFIIPNLFTAQDLKTKQFRMTDASDIKEYEAIYDAFPTEDILESVDFVLWNGPFGFYENGFIEGSERFLNMLCMRKEDDMLQSVAGGGDTVAIIRKLQGEECFNFISSGGGAMLLFLENETLPGISAILR